MLHCLVHRSHRFGWFHLQDTVFFSILLGVPSLISCVSLWYSFGGGVFLDHISNSSFQDKNDCTVQSLYYCHGNDSLTYLIVRLYGWHTLIVKEETCSSMFPKARIWCKVDLWVDETRWRDVMGIWTFATPRVAVMEWVRRQLRYGHVEIVVWRVSHILYYLLLLLLGLHFLHIPLWLGM